MCIFFFLRYEGARLKKMVSFMSRSLFPCEEKLRFPSSSRLGGSNCSSGRFEENRNLFHVPGVKMWFLSIRQPNYSTEIRCPASNSFWQEEQMCTQIRIFATSDWSLKTSWNDSNRQINKSALSLNWKLLVC